MKRFDLHFFLRFSFSHLLLSLLLMGPLSLSAQTYTGTLTLSSQAEVDAFSYMEVTGSLQISGADINNLNGLSSLVSVGINLSIYSNPVLINLDSLSNLTSIGGSLDIVSNPILPHIGGLSALTSIGVSLSIINNPTLVNVSGLPSLTSVPRDLNIVDNTALTDIDFLSSLTLIGQYLRFSRNTSLANLDGLSSLASVGADVSIDYNASLPNLAGLSSLNSLGGYLFIFENNSLLHIDGLSALTSIAGNMFIYNNSALVEFCGLYPLFNSGWAGSYNSFGNLDNPTIADIIAGGPCQLDPSQIITDLLAAGTLNQGQANALQGKVNNCNLNALNNQLSAFVNAGILTQVEANELSTAASQACNSPARKELPQDFVLGQNYPNPASTYTMIPFTLSTAKNISIDLYDTSGKQVKQVLNQSFQKGKHEVKVDLKSLPTGTYFYKIQIGEYSEMIPMIIE